MTQKQISEKRETFFSLSKKKILPIGRQSPSLKVTLGAHIPAT